MHIFLYKIKHAHLSYHKILLNSGQIQRSQSVFNCPKGVLYNLGLCLPSLFQESDQYRLFGNTLEIRIIGPCLDQELLSQRRASMCMNMDCSNLTHDLSSQWHSAQFRCPPQRLAACRYLTAFLYVVSMDHEQGKPMASFFPHPFQPLLNFILTSKLNFETSVSGAWLQQHWNIGVHYSETEHCCRSPSKHGKGIRQSHPPIDLMVNFQH